MNSVNKDIKYLSNCSFGQTKRKRSEEPENFVEESEEANICNICLTAMDNPLVTPCNHSFHLSCLCNWLDKHRTCPVCRQVFTPQEISRMCPSDPKLPWDPIYTTYTPEELAKRGRRPAVKIEWD